MSILDPQVTTEPSDFKAANAHSVEKISTTPELKEDDTEVLSPPLSLSPHATTEPSSFSAAKALNVVETSTTPELNCAIGTC